MREKNTEQLAPMPAEESRKHLAEYISKDETQKSPTLTAVEVRLSRKNRTKDRFEVILIDTEGSEIPVKFKFRCSKLIYIYTLLHPRGYQRRRLMDNNYQVLSRLYSLLFFSDNKSLLKSIDNTGFDHFVSQFVTQSRKAIRRASSCAEQFVIDRPQANNGKLLIPFVANGGMVIVDNSLLNNFANL